MATVTIVIIDTNIIATAPRLDSEALTSMIEHAEDWDLRIIAPEVVVMEAVNVVRRLWRTERDRLAGIRLGQFRLTDNQAVMVTAIDRESDEYEAWLPRRLIARGIEIEPVPAVEHMEIARRASAGRTPFIRGKDGKTKDGYRDTLVWLTVLAVAKGNPGEHVWLISDNHTDFGPKPGNWTGPGTGERDDCPILFNEQLADELAVGGLADRVHYVVSAETLEQHLASQFAPIADAELGQLTATLNMTSLAGSLMYSTLGQHVDAEAAALPPGATAGEITLVREQHEGWSFVDAARRAEKGWTSRFIVDTRVDIEITGAPWLDKTLSKVLRVTGRISVSPDGDLLDMSVDSIEAVPNDPDRDHHRRRRDDHGRSTARAALTGLNASVMKDIAAQLGSGPNITEMLREQNTELRKAITERFAGPDVTEILKRQNAELMRDIAAQISGPNFNEILKKQNAELMKKITARLDGPGIPGVSGSKSTGGELLDGTTASRNSAKVEPEVNADPTADGTGSESK